MRGKVGATKVGRSRGVSEEVGPVQGAMAGGEENFAAGAPGKGESRG